MTATVHSSLTPWRRPATMGPMSTNPTITAATEYAAAHWDVSADLFDSMVVTVEAFWPTTGWTPITRESLTDDLVRLALAGGATHIAVEQIVTGRRADFALVAR